MPQHTQTEDPRLRAQQARTQALQDSISTALAGSKSVAKGLGREVSNLNEFLLGDFKRTAKEVGVPEAFRIGIENIPSPLDVLRESGPGQRVRGLIEQFRFGAAGPPTDVSGEPLQGPAEPPGLGEPAQQAVQPPVPQFTPRPDIEVPQLAAPPPVPPADFSAARKALGPPVEAQSVSQGEAVQRALGGAAGGALGASQGAPRGRVASIGELISGAGAGSAEALAQVHKENRTLEELARTSESLRARQLSSIELVQEATIAEQNQEAADAFERREFNKANLLVQVSIANAQASRMIGTADGLFDPTTGKFISTRRETATEILQSFFMMQEAVNATTQRMGIVLGRPILLTNLSEVMQGPVDVALQAMNDPDIVPLLIEVLEDRGNDNLANELRRLVEGIASTTDDQAISTASIGTMELAYMVLEEIRVPGTHVWLQPFISTAARPSPFQLPGARKTSELTQALGQLGF